MYHPEKSRDSASGALQFMDYTKENTTLKVLDRRPWFWYLGHSTKPLSYVSLFYFTSSKAQFCAVSSSSANQYICYPLNQSGECRPCFVSWSTRPKWSTNKWKIRDELIFSGSPYTGFCGVWVYYKGAMKNGRLSGGCSMQYKRIVDAVKAVKTLNSDCTSRSLRNRCLRSKPQWRPASFLSFCLRQDSQ